MPITVDIERTLYHLSSTSEGYAIVGAECDEVYAGGFPLSQLFDHAPAHGTRYRVTVEVIAPGTPCAHDRWGDGVPCSLCTNPSPST